MDAGDDARAGNRRESVQRADGQRRAHRVAGREHAGDREKQKLRVPQKILRRGEHRAQRRMGTHALLRLFPNTRGLSLGAANRARGNERAEAPADAARARGQRGNQRHIEQVEAAGSGRAQKDERIHKRSVPAGGLNYAKASSVRCRGLPGVVYLL